DLHLPEQAAFDTGVLTDADGAFELPGLLPRDYCLRIIDLEALHSFETRAFAAGTDNALIAVPEPPDLQPAWSGRVVDADGNGIAGASISASLWVPVDGLGSMLLHATEVTTAADGSASLPAQSATGITVRIESPGHMLEARTRARMLEREIVLGRIVRFRYRSESVPASHNQRRLQVLDAQDRPLVIAGPYMGSIIRGYQHYMNDGKTGVLMTSELATTLVIYTDDGSEHRNQPHRFPIHLQPGEITVIE
ncbi:MAG: carboxypeptidase regulatory-like domain-containing protein, partial [Planctomycetes bacterium]|nr:carboxypeptidase regulatory-like domain-containing protein [Planctomycetota bacterium]